MNQKHRDVIDSCCEEIVTKINMNKLWPKLLENKIFNRDDVNLPRWKKNLTDDATIRDIYLTVKTRGPLAFDRFLVSLRQSDHENLADILEGKRISYITHGFKRRTNNQQVTNDNDWDDTNCYTNIEPIIPTAYELQDNFFHNMQLSEKPLEIQVRKAVKFLDEPVNENVQRYPMRSKPRGLVLIITNIHYKYSDRPRSSAAHDEVNLRELFEQMGFEVTSYRDLTGQELLNKVTEFSRRKEFRNVDSCFVTISSHGSMNTQYEVTEIEGVDYDPESKRENYKTVLCMDILNCFTTKACPHLAGKPKIFLFQLCRGEKKQRSVKEPRSTTDTLFPDEIMNIKMRGRGTMRNYADMFIAHATLPGHVAFRDKITGSWFLQILCEVFMNYAYETHLQDLLHMVDDRLRIQRTTEEECQTLMVTGIGFNKHCYLNPGLFVENIIDKEQP